MNAEGGKVGNVGFSNVFFLNHGDLYMWSGILQAVRKFVIFAAVCSVYYTLAVCCFPKQAAVECQF